MNLHRKKQNQAASQQEPENPKEMRKFKDKMSASAKLGIVLNAILIVCVCLMAIGIYTSGFKARPKRYNESDYISDVSINGWTYGEAANAPAAAGNFSEVAYTYEGIKGTEYTKSAKAPKNAGTYEVAAEIPGAPADEPGKRATTELKIDRAKVSVPEIDPKVYNGSHQVASIPDSDAWTVERNEGGTEKGSYDVILAPTGNYRWNMTDEKKSREPIVLEFEIAGEEEVKQKQQEKESLQAQKREERETGEDQNRQQSKETEQSKADKSETEKAKEPDQYQLTHRWNNTDNGWTVDPEDGSWYFILNHKAKTNWYCDPEDGNWYYFDPVTAKMVVGWNKIGADWYYFSESDAGQTWFMKADGMWHYDTTTRQKHRPYGSMYVDEYTPDGSYVNKVGAKSKFKY